MCADILGNNALAPCVYSAWENALKQAAWISGGDIVCNPPYERIEPFIDTLEEAYDQDNETRALLIIPIKNAGYI